MSPASPRPPARRADAERNRRTILAAARQAFDDAGAEISMAEISRRAGVGMATLYRHFPGRRELLEALYTDEIDVVCAAAEPPEDLPPGAALTSWLERVSAFFTGKRQVGAELLKHPERDGGDRFFTGGRDRVLAAGRPLLAAAQQAGEVRADLTIEQVLDLVGAITAIHGDAAYRQPILRVALNGIRAPGANPAPPPAARERPAP